MAADTATVSTYGVRSTKYGQGGGDPLSHKGEDHHTLYEQLRSIVVPEVFAQLRGGCPWEASQANQ